MPCTRVKVPGGYAIVCGRTKKKQACCSPGCKIEAVRLCDWKVPERKNGTCDTPICAFHSYEPPGHDDKDLCPEHAAEWKARLAARSAP